MMPINCTLPNFRLNINTLLDIGGVTQDIGDLTIVFNEPSNAQEFYNYLITPQKQYRFFVYDSSLELIPVLYSPASYSFDTVNLTTTQPGLPPSQNPPFLLPDKNLTSGQCRYYFPKTYTASVDEISDLRIRGQSRLETRTIDIEGRWLGDHPRMLSKGRYRASMLADGGEWVDGTYKHIPRFRSRFGLESYFGTPLLGVFDFDDLIEPDNLQPLDQQAQALNVTLPRGLL